MKLGTYITTMPYTVISGFMSGIGVIITVLQLPTLVLMTLASVLWLPAEALPRLENHQLEWGELRTISGFAFTLAVLGSIDSLLTSLVADNITRSQHDSDRELIGQGIGNRGAALAGASPAPAPRCAR